MTQGILPFKYESEKTSSGMTALAGLPLYCDLMSLVGLEQSVTRHLAVAETQQGWSVAQCVSALVLLNLAGGESVDDLRILARDSGFVRLMEKLQTHGMNRKQRRAFLRRWRTKRERALPSPSAIFRFLAKCHDPELATVPEGQKAYIPPPSPVLQGLYQVNRDILDVLQQNDPQKTATIDLDCTLVETFKQNATWCYKGYKAYQPANAYWFEQDVFLHSQFRDGNVPALYKLLWVFKDALASLPPGVKHVFLRSDTAGYKHDLLSYCNEAKNDRFGRITFAIGTEVCVAFKNAVREVPDHGWHDLYRTVDGQQQETGQQWTEVCYVPSWMARSKKTPAYRFIALREPIKQLTIPGTESLSDAPYPAYTDEQGLPYKLWGVVTNWEYDHKRGDEVIWWYRERCGNSEKAHFVQKHELAGGRLPSDLFGANAAWWQIMVLAYNLNSSMKRLVLEPIEHGWISRYLKAIRFHLINLPGRVYERSHQLFIRIGSDQEVHNLLLKARKRMMYLANAPPSKGTC